MPRGRQGFASMPIEKRRLIASLGGLSAHIQGKAHTWTKEEASVAGRKGGLKRKQTSIPDLNAGHR
jgi:uncharacterized protein